MSRRRSVDRFAKEARERKYRLRGTSTKFIPATDSGFAHMSRQFAGHIESNAERFAIAPEQVARLDTAVGAYRDALADTMRPCKAGPHATRIKKDARKHLETIVRAVARTVRACESITGVDRLMLNMHERPAGGRLKVRECPQVAPVLKFIDGTRNHTHIIEYGNDFDYGSSAKPKGTARLELFVGLVPPPEKANAIPMHPGQLSGGLLWYVRSYSTSRFEVEYPVMADGSAMLVVYWGRWADARGGVGPFSKTCVTRVEGGAPCLLPETIRFPSMQPQAPRGLWGENRRIQAPRAVPPLALPAASREALPAEESHIEGERVVELMAARIREPRTPRMLEAA